MFKHLRNAFFSGLFLLIPLGVTIAIFNILLQKIGAPASELFFVFLKKSWREIYIVDLFLALISTLIVVILITIVGLLSNYFLGKMLISWAEKILHKLPFISTVYKTVKQIVDTFAEQNKAVFKQVVLIRFPHEKTYGIGFLTGTCKGEVQTKTLEKVVNVFVPTTPNPTSGFLILVPEKDLIYLNMSVGDAMKVIISGGAVTPEEVCKLSENA